MNQVTVSDAQFSIVQNWQSSCSFCERFPSETVFLFDVP